METAQGIKWARGTLGRQPAGNSDLYWCEVKDGPTYLRKRDESQCQLCNQPLFDGPNRHDFVVHIEKKVAAKAGAP
jgi:hypothetical protein